VILGGSAATPRRVTITGLLFLLFFYKAQLATERGGGVNCRRSGEVVTSIVIYVPDYFHMGSILLQVVGKKRFSKPWDTVIVLGVIPPQLGGTALQERHVLVLHAEYPMNAEAGVPVIVRLAENDTEERGLLALVQSVGVTVHVTEKAGEGGVGVDPADAQFPRSLEFCKPEHPGFVSLGGVY